MKVQVKISTSDSRFSQYDHLLCLLTFTILPPTTLTENGRWRWSQRGSVEEGFHSSLFHSVTLFQAMKWSWNYWYDRTSIWHIDSWGLRLALMTIKKNNWGRPDGTNVSGASSKKAVINYLGFLNKLCSSDCVSGLFFNLGNQKTWIILGWYMHIPEHILCNSRIFLTYVFIFISN